MALTATSATLFAHGIAAAIGVTLLLNCGLVSQFSNGITATSLAKISYPLKEVRRGYVGVDSRY